MARITSQFGYRTEASEVVAGHDLSGQTVMVTGAASGLGVETARALASIGARVVLPVRNIERGITSAEDILLTNPGSKVEVMELDLASLASVRDFADAFLASHDSLDILINNAAVMATPQGATSDGFELQFGTNHLGHFELFRELLPALRENGGARVVALSSIGHRRSNVIFDDPNFERREYEKWSAYGQSKTACSLFALGVTQRFANEGIFANAVHPGGIITGLQKSLSFDEQQAMGWFDAEGNINERFKTVSQGASTSLWAAVGPELSGVGGLYLEDCNESVVFDEANPWVGYFPYAVDPDGADQLWDLSESLIASI